MIYNKFITHFGAKHPYPSVSVLKLYFTSHVYVYLFTALHTFIEHISDTIPKGKHKIKAVIVKHQSEAALECVAAARCCLSSV